MKHIKKFKQGKQGVVGLVEIDGRISVYKISQLMNFIPRHEYLVMKDLECVSKYCPHFCVPHELIQCDIHNQFTDDAQNPFEQCESALRLDTLLFEYIDNSISFTDLIERHDATFDEILAVVKQVLIGLSIAQDAVGLTHYDLHPSNILLRRCPKDMTHIYVLSDGSTIQMQTHGWVPVLIDFGFARSNIVDKYPMYNSLAFTDVGFMYPLFDPIADAKILLVSICTMLKEVDTYTTKVDGLRNIIKNIFSGLDINWQTGWDCEEESVIGSIMSYLDNDLQKSETMSQYSYSIMDIFQSLIILPLHERTTPSLRDLRKGINGFIDSFLPIEDEIDDPFYSLYAINLLVDMSRETLRKDFDDAQEEFTKILEEVLDVLGIASILSKIDVDVMLCSLMVIKEQFEAKIVELLNKRLKIKNKSYDKLPVTSVREILALIDSVFPPQRVPTQAIVYDAVSKQSYTLVDSDLELFKTYGFEDAMHIILEDEWGGEEDGEEDGEDDGEEDGEEDDNTILSYK